MLLERVAWTAHDIWAIWWLVQSCSVSLYMQLVCLCIDGVKAPFENISIVLHFFREKETDEKLKQLRTVLQKLPTENYINLRYVRVWMFYIHLKLLMRILTPHMHSVSIFDFSLSIRYLVQFLSHLSEQQAANKMTPSNIAIVLGPNLLWPLCEGSV